MPGDHRGTPAGRGPGQRPPAYHGDHPNGVHCGASAADLAAALRRSRTFRGQLISKPPQKVLDQREHGPGGIPGSGGPAGLGRPLAARPGDLTATADQDAAEAHRVRGLVGAAVPGLTLDSTHGPGDVIDGTTVLCGYPATGTRRGPGAGGRAPATDPSGRPTPSGSNGSCSSGRPTAPSAGCGTPWPTSRARSRMLWRRVVALMLVQPQHMGHDHHGECAGQEYRPHTVPHHAVDHTTFLPVT
jgi:hypothetical protein